MTAIEILKGKLEKAISESDNTYIRGVMKHTLYILIPESIKEAEATEEQFKWLKQFKQAMQTGFGLLAGDDKPNPNPPLDTINKTGG